MASACFVLCVALGVAPFGSFALAQESKPANATSRALRAEAETLQREKSEQWAAWLEKLDGAVAEHNQRYAGWMRRGLPPPLDLKPLELPLSVLVYRMEHPLVGDKLERGWARLPWPLLDAISHHSNPQRMDYLLEQYDRCDFGSTISWYAAVVDALTPERAAREISDRMGPRPKNLGATDLVYRLLDRFADRLPPEMRARGYAYLRGAVDSSPDDGSESDIWGALLKLDVAAASRELVEEYVHADLSRRGDLFWRVPPLLAQAPPVPADVARSLKRFLAEGQPADWPHLRAQLWTVVFRSNPVAELDDYVAQLDQVIARSGAQPKSTSSVEVAVLTEALLSDGPPAALPVFRRLAECPLVPATMRDGMRERLARAKDPQ